MQPANRVHTTEQTTKEVIYNLKIKTIVCIISKIKTIHQVARGKMDNEIEEIKQTVISLSLFCNTVISPCP